MSLTHIFVRRRQSTTERLIYVCEKKEVFLAKEILCECKRCGGGTI